MTYRDKCNGLHKEMVKALTKYQKAEIGLLNLKSPTDRFKLVEKRNEYFVDWQNKQFVYNNFLEYVAQLGKTLDEKM